MNAPRTAPWMLLALALGCGCVFTSRPQLPLEDDAAAPPSDSPAAYNDVGAPGADAAALDVPAFDDVQIPPASDAAAPRDASASGDHGGEADDCFADTRPGAVDGGDAGFVNQDGEPCDPHARSDAGPSSDASGDAVTDASADAPTDAADDAPADAGSDATGDVGDVTGGG